MRRFAALGVTALAVLASVIVLASGTTLAAGAPTAATGAASGITNTQASLAGTVNPAGQLTSFAFQYGTSTAYGQQSALTSAGSGSADAPVSANLAGLTPGTAYHYRVIATNASGTVVGADRTFTTTGTAPPPAPKPGVTTGSASVSGSTASLTGAVNPNGVETSYYFEFGTTADYGTQTAPQSAGSGSQAVSISSALSGLKASTTYHYRLVAVAPGGAVATGDDATFSTTTSPTRLAFFGRTSFADQHGVGGVFLGCFGTSRCTGSLTLSRSGKVLGTRSAYAINANDGGFVHVTLNALGQSLLRSRGTMNVSAAVANTNGQKVAGKLKLVRFSTRGLKG
jgi:phosphodiesterase/alkaline phosphatase D-like protein